MVLRMKALGDKPTYPARDSGSSAGAGSGESGRGAETHTGFLAAGHRRPTRRLPVSSLLSP